MEPVAETHVARKPEPSPAQLRSMSLVSASATVAVYCARLSIWLSACPLKLRSVSPEIWYACATRAG